MGHRPRWTHERLGRVLRRHGRSLDELDEAPDELAHDQPALASCYGASAGDRQLLGNEPGQRTRKLVDTVLEPAKPGEALADVGGVNVHASMAIPPRDRRRLERLCRYVARPPVSQERLELAADGRCLSYRFKRPWRDGTWAVVLDPLDFIARLASLIPPPKFHMLRYHGVLAAHATARSEVVPGPAPEPLEPTQLRLALDGEITEPEFVAKRASRHPWAWLLQRVFAVDVMVRSADFEDGYGPFDGWDEQRKCAFVCAVNRDPACYLPGLGYPSPAGYEPDPFEAHEAFSTLDAMFPGNAEWEAGYMNANDDAQVGEARLVIET